MATYAIGDIQGCLEPLKALLAQINFREDCDRLWLVGDLINRGPESLETLRFLHHRRDNIDCVLGNHDLHLLAVAHGQRKRSRSDTLDEILAAKDVDQLLEWLRHRPLLKRDKQLGYSMVHAGIPPCWTISQAEACASEVESALRSRNFSAFLGRMYGNEPDVWSESLKGMERLRVITNYFTRMRFCDTDSRLELTTKGDTDSGLEGYAPWFTYPRADGERIVFGHWAALEGRCNSTDMFALDTGCVWGGHLTALRLEDQTRISCNCS